MNFYLFPVKVSTIKGKRGKLDEPQLKLQLLEMMWSGYKACCKIFCPEIGFLSTQKVLEPAKN